jgi:hypothetical protein
MADNLDFEQISDTGKAPKTRILDCKSLNAVVKKLVELDLISALNRQDVQAAVDGKPPFDERWMIDSGQEGRCNLNFQDLKKRVKRECMSYYDLTESVPVLANVTMPMNEMDATVKTSWCQIMSEEWHKMLKDWNSFNPYYQLLVQKFVTHGLGFLFFEDDINWKWRVAGLEDFKLPRMTTLAEEEVDIAVAFRDVTTSQLYHWCEQADDSDKRWNKQEVYKAILNSYSNQAVWSQGEWEKWQTILKDNDIYAAHRANEYVKLAYCWVREYSGKVSYYLTLRLGVNDDFLFKCENRFDNVNQCFNFFPYEVGTNGTLMSVRGLAQERYAPAQVLNTLRCDTVDNARLAGKVILQPKSAIEAEDMSLIFYGGVVYIPPEVTVQNIKLANPEDAILPVVQDMSNLLQGDQPNLSSATNQPQGDQRKTKFQVQKEATEESVIPTAALDLFYPPWKRHLNEAWRRTKNKDLKASDPGGREVFDFRKRCHNRGVPMAVLLDPESWVEPYRAVGYGSPTSRLMAFDEFMQYWGSLDAVGQNNLLRDRFAQKVTYSQVDNYVPRLKLNGRMPLDAEIAELQNAAMSAGVPVSVMPNDHHILHLQAHLPNLENDLEQLEGPGQGNNPQLLQVAEAKTQHSARHIEYLKPDKLNAEIVSELNRKFNNLSERTSAAAKAYQIEQAKQQAKLAAQQTPTATGLPPEAEEHAQNMDQNAAEHQQDVGQSAQKHGLDLQAKTTEMQQKAEAHAMAMKEKQANLARADDEHKLKLKHIQELHTQSLAEKEKDGRAKRAAAKEAAAAPKPTA